MNLETLRHSCAHVMAVAVKKLWPDVKLGIGPSIENGFYYDFDKTEPFVQEDLVKIEKTMLNIIQQKVPFTKEKWTKDQAQKCFQEKGETYKIQLIDDLDEGEDIFVYKTGEDFLDLCKGPHINNTGEIKDFKLLSIAGSYWKGDENNPQLQRIYGTCFEKKDELDEYLKFLDEAQKRDHRQLGVQLDLFNFYHETAGAGMVFYHPAGAMLRKQIVDYIESENLKRGYQLLSTPHLFKGDLWEKSGHMQYYRENMYVFDIDDQEHVVKPMNCPGHILIYKSQIRSYRELPLRFSELGTVYRREKAGVLHGLLRVRGFTQDDAHIFCRENQVKDEVKDVIDFVFSIMNDFGFSDWAIELSTRPEKSIGSDEDWQLATKALKESLEEKQLSFQINEGDGAFYGPKIDIKLRDALNREWQCATIQCDFSLPQRFDLNYVNEEGKQVKPIMIHRAMLGSLERFIGTLIEHYAGAFPIWLAPVQVLMIPIKDKHDQYAESLQKDLQNQGIRSIIDKRNESLGKRIREGTIKKVPYLLILGDKEESSKTVAVRKYKQGDQGSLLFDDFVKKAQQEIQDKQ